MSVPAFALFKVPQNLVDAEAIKNHIRIFKPFGSSVLQNAVEAGCTEVRREGHVPTSRPPKSHVVDRHPFAEPPEGHVPTALCEIPLRSSRSTNAVIANRVILNVSPRHPEQCPRNPE